MAVMQAFFLVKFCVHERSERHSSCVFDREKRCMGKLRVFSVPSDEVHGSGLDPEFQQSYTADSSFCFKSVCLKGASSEAAAQFCGDHVLRNHVNFQDIAADMSVSPAHVDRRVDYPDC